MAFANLVAFCYVVMMTLLTSSMVFFVLIPQFYGDYALWVHRCVIVYIFVNVSGNFYLCATTDTSVERLGPVSSERTNMEQTGTGEQQQRVRECSLSEETAKHKPMTNCNIERSKKIENCGGDTFSPHEISKRRTFNGESREHLVKAETCPRCLTGNTSGVPNLAETELTCSRSTSINSSQKGSQRRDQKEATIPIPPSVSSDCGLSVRDGLTKPSGSVTRSVPEPLPVAGIKPTRKPAAGRQRLQTSSDLRPERRALNVAMETSGHEPERFLHVVYGVNFHGPQTFFLLMKDFLGDLVWVGRTPSLGYCLLLYEMCACLVVTLVTGGFLYWQLCITASGQTTYEVRNGSSRYSKASVKDNFRDVFGRHWPLLFFLPLPLPQAGNGCYSSPRRRVDRSTCAGRTKDELSHPGGDLMEKEKSKKGQEAARKILPSSEQKERLFKRDYCTFIKISCLLRCTMGCCTVEGCQSVEHRQER
ncbi:hypothetical protein C0Q70_13782 [Pomacea canaliculata]|uniref:Palmitoyltransferase n=1 Tax=Pomacea canaliculata TaxID=400727 RepID=A0A2T7NY78_POMCA|nr:hypothetical protein C0Q70_13782 [Pomacea canaliculata]